MLEPRFRSRLARKVVDVANGVEAVSAELEKIEAALSQVGSQADELKALEEQLALLEESELDAAVVDDDELELALQPLDVEKMQTYRQPLGGITPADYLDPLGALEKLVAEEQASRMDRESLRALLGWNAFDVAVVGAAGVLAAVTDFFLVGLPSGRSVGHLTRWMKSYDTTSSSDVVARVARALEARCKVPYDTLRGSEPILGMSGRTHRFQTLGHDPVLGFVFGVLDILRGTVTGFSYDKLKSFHLGVCMDSPSGHVGTNIVEAFLTQLGHLLSDVATPAGLPAPLMAILQSFNRGSFGKDGKTLAEVSRRMYTKGYDLRHFFATGVSAGVAHAVLHAFLGLRTVSEDGACPRYHPLKKRRMFLAAHSIAALGNAGKVALHQGNPLAVNQAEWMAVFTLLGPSLRDFVFHDELELQHLNDLLRSGWQELSKESHLEADGAHSSDSSCTAPAAG
jgi:hypothetical protein